MKCLTASLGTLLVLGLAVTATAASAGESYRSVQGCAQCASPKKYDTQEVQKTVKEVDHSAVIETKSLAPSRRVIETNHLIVHENETRNVGVIQHNHTVIEKELVLTKRNIDNKTVNTFVNLVEHKYNTQRVREVEERELPGTVRDLRECNCEVGGRSGRAIRAYGMASR